MKHSAYAPYDQSSIALLLLTAIADEIKKDPGQAIVKIEKLRQQIPNSYEGFRTAEELEKAGFK